MKHRAQLSAAALTCVLALVGCGQQATGDGEPTDTVAGGSGSTDTPSDDVATPEPGTSIPDDFPLSDGMGGPEDEIPTSRTGTGLRDLELCGTAPLRGLGVRDRLVADNSGGEALDTRELLLLGSPEEANELAQRFTDLPTSCDAPSVRQGFETLTEVRASAFGSRPPAATLVQTYEQRGDPVPGAMVIHVVPVGTALLVTMTYGEWADVSAGVSASTDLLRDVVGELDMFAGDPTTGGGPVVERAPIPDDFPLLAGWPEDSAAEAGADNGRHGPTRTADPVVLRACGEPWPEPDHLDRLRADWVDAEDYRTRQLTVYGGDDAASAAIAGMVAHLQACPSEAAGDDGFATTREVRPASLGDEAWAVLERDTFDGSPSIFGESSLVVRVGRAVLVVRHGGHAGYPSGDGRDQVEAMGSQAARPIATMCVFTKTGC